MSLSELLSYFRPPTAAEAFIRQIDQEIATLDDAARVLKLKRNTAVPISRLPPELLSWVFICLRDEYIFPKTRIEPKWICVSHVCSRWRSTALACPRLWNVIDTEFGAMWVQEMIHRSGGTPLSFSGKMSWGNTLSVQSLLKDHVGRLRAVSLVSSSDSHPAQLADFLASISQASVPHLESLGITFDFPKTLPGMPLLSTQGQTGLFLRSLELRDCILAWDKLVPMPTLTSLTISFCVDFEQPSIDEVTAALRGMPLLRELELEKALLEMDDDHVAPRRNVHLPCLASLSILKSGVRECSALLGYLTLLPTTCLKLECCLSSTADHDALQLLPTFTYFAGLIRDKHKEEHVKYGPISEMTCRCERDSIALRLSGWRDTMLELQLMFMENDGRIDVSSDSLTLLSVFSLTDLESLDISNLPEDFAGDDWFRPFAWSPSLHEIHVTGDHAARVAIRSLLFQKDGDGDNDGAGLSANTKPAVSFSYPSLWCLQFSGCSGYSYFGDFFEDLHNAVLKRSQKRLYIDLLLLDSSQLLSETQVEALEELIGEVIADTL
ncbi:hypothetical protein Hypma_005535 [Hypsizygus marmoreus]|uniref:Uncharacterized protein n=1 Tax=Hypsizygus marmoreus TaxID=39966 RepID=A0A369JY29_HYPMA|nr:hypothetical protein Hypma_005535 [Hypsizygus marmoreus]